MTQIQKIKRKLIHRPPGFPRLQSWRSVKCESIVDPKTKSPSPLGRWKCVLVIGYWDLRFIWNLMLVICNLLYLYNILIGYTFNW